MPNPRSHIRLLILAGALAGAMAAASPALAGPPFATDDPAPTEKGHWEVYNFVGGTRAGAATSGEAGFDLNYGAAENLQLTAVFPAAWSDAGGLSAGSGDIELAAKYRFTRQDGPVGLDVALFPRLFLPTAYDRAGDRHPSLFLPIWAQRDSGRWSVFGGGGYLIDPGAGHRDSWSGGLAVSRQMSKRFTLGAEVYGRTADTPGGKSFAGTNLAATWKITNHWSILASTGPGVLNARDEGRYDVYLALKADY